MGDCRHRREVFRPRAFQCKDYGTEHQAGEEEKKVFSCPSDKKYKPPYFRRKTHTIPESREKGHYRETFLCGSFVSARFVSRDIDSVYSRLSLDG